MMKIILETERLILREFTEVDAPFLLHLVNTPPWLRYIGDRKVRTVEDAEAYLRKGPIDSYRRLGFGFYLVALKDSGTPIGMCGVSKREELEEVDIGFALLPEHTGLGYAYEAAAATLGYARDVLKLKRLVAITHPDNDHSIRLLKKIGLTQEGTVLHSGEEVLFFGIDFPGK